MKPASTLGVRGVAVEARHRTATGRSSAPRGAEAFTLQQAQSAELPLCGEMRAAPPPATRAQPRPRPDPALDPTPPSPLGTCAEQPPASLATSRHPLPTIPVL